jgi:quercetin dioxygenase-like cupin family protein
MWSLFLDRLDLADAWIDGVPSARWRSAAAHGPSTGASSSGSSLIEVDEGCMLPRHTDSAEETIVVLDGQAEVTVGEDRAEVAAQGMALVPKDAPHSVRNAGLGKLRFVAFYSAHDVVSRYEEEVQPDGGRERSPVG